MQLISSSGLATRPLTPNHGDPASTTRRHQEPAGTCSARSQVRATGTSSLREYFSQPSGVRVPYATSSQGEAANAANKEEARHITFRSSSSRIRKRTLQRALKRAVQLETAKLRTVAGPSGCGTLTSLDPHEARILPSYNLRMDTGPLSAFTASTGTAVDSLLSCNWNGSLG